MTKPSSIISQKVSKEPYQALLNEPVKSESEIDESQVEQFIHALKRLEHHETLEEQLYKYYQKILDTPVVASEFLKSFRIKP